MELLLNLLWLSVAAVALARYMRVSPGCRQQFLTGLGALFCLLMLLLPAISITDDLHFDACAIEDSSCTKRLAKADVHASPVSHIAWFAIYLLTVLLADPHRLTWRGVLAPFVPRPHLWSYRPVLGRAPPCWLSLSGVYAA